MNEKGLEYLERIKEKNPDLYIEDRRSLGEAMFVTVGKALHEIFDELYLTSHTPNHCTPHTSYRLWIEKPVISGSGHPDWYDNRDIAVVEMWKTRISFEADGELCLKIVPKGIINYSQDRTRNRWIADENMFCNETRTYQLK